MIIRIVYVINVCFYFAFTEATATEIVMPTTFLRALVLLWDARDSFL
jgi:voltage-gated potassium channel Kch